MGLELSVECLESSMFPNGNNMLEEIQDQDRARRGVAWRGVARHGAARQGMEKLFVPVARLVSHVSSPTKDKARRGVARRGKARRGAAGQGKARNKNTMKRKNDSDFPGGWRKPFAILNKNRRWPND